jgi:hypothetical protein
MNRDDAQAVDRLRNKGMVSAVAIKEAVPVSVRKDKCTRRFVPVVEPIPRYLFNPMGRNRFSAATATNPGDNIKRFTDNGFPRKLKKEKTLQF